jgi:hypothetical protein
MRIFIEREVAATRPESPTGTELSPRLASLGSLF